MQNRHDLYILLFLANLVLPTDILLALEEGTRLRDSGANRDIYVGDIYMDNGVKKIGQLSFELSPLNVNDMGYISYLAGIRRNIDLVWQRQPDVANRGFEWDASLEAVIGENGEISRVALAEGTKDASLNSSVLASIHKSGPFHPLPAGLKVSELVVKINIHYRYQLLKEWQEKLRKDMERTPDDIKRIMERRKMK